MGAKTICPTAEVRRTTVGQMALLQRGSAAAFPLLVGHPQISGPGGAEISFCHTIDHCRTILYYTVLYLDLAPRRRYCGLFTLLYRPGSLPGAQTLTERRDVSRIQMLFHLPTCGDEVKRPQRYAFTTYKFRDQRCQKFFYCTLNQRLGTVERVWSIYLRSNSDRCVSTSGAMTDFASMW